MLPHALVKRRERSPSAESNNSTASNKRSNSGSSSQLNTTSNTPPTTVQSHHTPSTASSRMAAMDINPGSNDGSSSASTEPLMSENGEASSSSTTTGTAIPARHSPPADGQVQLQLVLDPAKKPLAEGDTWFVVDRRWFRRWQAACGSSKGDDSDSKDLQDVTMEEVGPIDNSQITDPTTGRLLRPVVEGQDVVFLPGESWHLLEAWYGTTGLPVQRDVIKLKDGILLDLAPPLVTICSVVPANSAQLPTPAKQLQTSSAWTIKHLKERMAEALGCDAQAVSRIWLLEDSTDSSQTILNATVTPDKLEHASLEPAGDDEVIRYSSISEDATLALEVANEDGTWIVSNHSTETSKAPAQTKKSSFFSGPSFLDNITHKTQAKRAALTTNSLNHQDNQPVASTSNLSAQPMRMTRSQTGSSGSKKGLVGLTNLGNTCFMNSALQCLSNTPALQEYFHSGFWQSELNPSNPLGMKGEVAKAYGQLMDRIWNGSQAVTTPREFKQTLSKFAPAFSGWQQHDSQELIAFLLDGLHEDLNRIKKKPYEEVPDWNGGTEKDELELANLSWEIYKRRNDSVIVDLFQGQLRNRLICPECGKIAIKFDPFMYLSLAIPQTKKWSGDVYLVPLDPQKPEIKVTLELPANASMKKLKQAVGDLTGYDPKKLFIAEEYSHKFWKVWSDSETVGKVQSRDVLVLSELPYEIEQPTYRPTNSKTPEEEGKFFVTVLCSKGANSTHTYSSKNLFGVPFILALTEEEACNIDIIEQKICERLESWQGVGKKIWSAAGAASTSPSKPSGRPVIADDEEEEQAPVDGKDTDMEEVSVSQEEPSSAHAPTPSSKAISFLVAKRPFTGYDNKPFTDSSSSDRCTLRERLANMLAAQKPVAHHTSLPGSFSQEVQDDLYGDAEEEDNTAKPAEFTKADTSIAPQPIIRTGETILVEWNPRFATEAFGSEIDKSRGDSTERFAKEERVIDPVITERRKLGNSKAQKQEMTIENLLDEFVKEEKLSEDNMWYCSSCKKHQEAPKKFDLWKMPDVLVIHLKRFSNERAFRDKIDTFIDFPVSGLDLTDRVEGKKVAAKLAAKGDAAELIEETGTNDSLVYDLFAVDNHYGGLGGGHYTAFAKNIVDGKWYNFDDSRVSPVSNPDDVKTPAAYLLFYVRRTSKPIGGKTHEILASKTVTPALSAAGSRPTSPPPYDRNGADSAMNDADNDDTDDLYSSQYNSATMPSPALSGSDDELDRANSTSVGIRNWQNGTAFGSASGRPSSALGWDFARSTDELQHQPQHGEDATMSSGLPSPSRRTGSPSPAVVEIRVDEGDVAEAASGVDMSTSSHMDELE